jgi:ORF6N domain
MPKTIAIVPAERIDSRILLIRGHRVMLDADLAEVYGTTTKALNQAVKRNRKRFPSEGFRRTVRTHEPRRAMVLTRCFT